MQPNACKCLEFQAFRHLGSTGGKRGESETIPRTGEDGDLRDPPALEPLSGKDVFIINTAILARVAPQGFRPGLRTDAPIRGLKTSRCKAKPIGPNAVLFLDRLSGFRRGAGDNLPREGLWFLVFTSPLVHNAGKLETFLPPRPTRSLGMR